MPDNTPQKIIRILLIEDDDFDAKFLRRQLDRVPDVDYHVHHTLHVDAAAAALQNADFDVILADLGLTFTSGIATLEALRPISREIPIVVLTGANEDEDNLGMRCVAAGAEDYIQKSTLTTPTLRRTVGFAMWRSREAHVRRLEETLVNLKSLSQARPEGSSHKAPLRERDPHQFTLFQQTYLTLMEHYTNGNAPNAKPQGQMQELITALGDQRCGPRTLMDLHAQALEDIIQGHMNGRPRPRLKDGRLLIIEMMGLLVEYYRIKAGR